MSRVYTLTESNVESIAQRVAGILADCGICIIPTDTIYGIVALEQCSKAVYRIYEIKKRPVQKQFIRLISGPDRLRDYTDQTVPPELLRYWPGPLTIVVRGLDGKTVALRYPDDPFLHALFGYLDNKSIVAPSANISGEENILDCRELVRVFDGFVDCVVCSDRSRKKNSASIRPVASTIVDISGLRARVIRRGALEVLL